MLESNQLQTDLQSVPTPHGTVHTVLRIQKLCTKKPPIHYE
ncbi:hypothetical protein CLOSTHATH_07500 [Hungatella hathewayi DSM 13479]|uniref:Uncharacterized protein n=1 Tax=Hungatella hathewayi DSM 13479 TaxID=566550 RepID=D3AV28_9FIRM|nr:hypothetical protein CLOSTHATH_07500 [Hungatella hathewayi DSM 13479]